MILWEIAGWLLLATGLFVFSQAYALFAGEPAKVLEPAGLTFIGVFVFRGGIHLLKIAAAARVCREVRDRVLRPASDPKPRKVGG